jgi:peptidoglycan/LPS O-acetylase OafA/YrhL
MNAGRLPLAAWSSRGRENNFDVLRLFAAALVLISHSFPLTRHREPLSPHTLGTAGVEIFFALSGFLVTKSWLDAPQPALFLRKRVLRIFPGLIGALAVTSLVLGPAMSTLSPLRYFGSGQTWTYLDRNVLLFSTWSLPGVFTGNPLRAVNGSLWTLPVEFRAYLLLALVGLAGLLGRRRVAPLMLALAAVVSMNSTAPGLRLGCVFVGGAALYVLRERITLRTDVALVAAAVWLAAYPTRFAPAAGVLALPYVLVFLAYRSPRRLRRLTAAGDVSYGFYVYAFPTQQTIVALAGPIAPAALIAIAGPIVWLLGLASWRLVERPFLRLKQPQSRSRELVPAGAATQRS